MKFQIEAEALVKVKNRIKAVVLNSSLVKKSIYLMAEKGQLYMYAKSERNYGQVSIPCEVEKAGFVEMNALSFDSLDFVEGMLTFSLKEDKLRYTGPKVKSHLNVNPDEPDFRPEILPTTWITLPKTVFDILYCTTKDNLNFENIFFDGYKIAATAQVASAGYRHPTLLTDQPFTVPESVFTILGTPSSTFDMAIEPKKIWFREGSFYVSTPTIDYTNNMVAQLGYYEYDKPLAFFEITLDQAKKLCGYVASLSDGNMAALLLKEGILTVIPSGNEVGTGSMEIPCLKAEGEMNFGLSAKSMFNAVNRVDHDICRGLLVSPLNSICLLIEGHSTRHIFNEIPSARYNG